GGCLPVVFGHPTAPRRWLLAPPFRSHLVTVTPLKNCIKYCLNPATTHPVALWRGCSRGCLSVCLSADSGGCKLCPVGWTLHRSKCFLVASKSSSWRESREKCSHQRAQLLVPEDQGELDFLNQVIQKPTRYFWIGLSQPSVGMGWTWLDGSRLDQSRFNLSTPNASGACGALREDRIISETCGSALAWICQKEAVLL
uniref:C-type lectin domain-containing protein n=1 Tax=Cairina moschata TaxID=8855 RepID=A0A8C3BP89_CAIMO